MKKKARFTAIVTAAVMTLSLVPATGAHAATVVRLDPSNASPFNGGRFEGWGTSMGWWGNRIGDSDTLSKQAAKDLFSEEDGLGLDIVRYNVGGGDHPEHTHVTRSDSKLPCFAEPEYVGGEPTYDSDGKVNNFVMENGRIKYTLNKDADKNQVTVLQEIQKVAKEQGSKLHIEGYTNSPPWFMTITQCSGGGPVIGKRNNGDPKGDENLDPSNYAAFADFLVDAVKIMEEKGVHFDSYSPMNEPNTDSGYWFEKSPKQEGNLVAPGAHQSGIINAVNAAFDKAGIDAIIAGLDETDIGYSISSFNALDADAKKALGRLDTHTYGGSNRAGLRATAIAGGKNLWMSEVDDKWNGFGLADRIITDLNGMQASAWVLWDIIDKHKDSEVFQYPANSGTYPEANASLDVTGEMWGMGMANHDTKEIEWANKYWAYGQFTRYINPGDTLIPSSNRTLAAYNKDTGAIKIVVNNSGSADIPYEFDLSAFRTVGDKITEIRSNNKTGGDAEHWAEITGEATLEDKILTTTAKAGTITTYVIERTNIEKPKVTTFTATGKGLSYSYTLPADMRDETAYFAVYDSDGVLKYLSIDKNSESVDGNFEGCDYKLLVWDKMTPADNVDYAFISGGDGELSIGMTVPLECRTNIKGDITWSVDKANIASITQDGKLTIKSSGTFTVSATVGGHTSRKAFDIQSYKLSGTASWGNDSNAPKDSDDYRKAADGDLDTYFDGTTGGWVMYDFGAPYKASLIKLAARSGNGMADRTKDGKVQVSNDAITWTDLYTLTSAIPADSYTEVASSKFTDSTGAYRYYRYTNEKNMANIAEFQIEGDYSNNIPAGDPTVEDIAAFTDSFEGGSHIFGEQGKVLTTELERFGKVFAPVHTTATASVDDAIELKPNQLFRLKFDTFSGYLQGDSNSKDEFFSIKDANGTEIVSYAINLNTCKMMELKIGGTNVLSGTPTFQCKSNLSGRTGGNGWTASSQPYRNYMGFNIIGEILIEGTGNVSVSFKGGLTDITATGTISTPVAIKSIVVQDTQNNSDRTTAYDNLDADVITYNTNFETPAPPTPTPVPTATPEPTNEPVLPSDGTLISLDFENGLESGSTYGKASGTPTIVEDAERGGKVVKFSNDKTGAEVITLTDANGNSLLAGQEEITISFAVKPTVSTPSSWWFFTAPNDNEQKYQNEHYVGAFLNKDDGKLVVERYNNSGSRVASNSGSITLNEWHNVIITISEGKTDLYIDGELAQSVASSYKLTDILGANPVAYLGHANWGSGEYATGYIDDFVIKAGTTVSPLDTITLGDTSAVTSDITLPTENGITWTSDKPNIVSNTGAVTRPDETTTVTLTASYTENNVTYTRKFTVTVIGLTKAADTFTAYAEGDKIYFVTGYMTGDKYDVTVELRKASDNQLLVSTSASYAEGNFYDIPNGVYKVVCNVMDGTTVKKTVTKTVEVKDEIDAAAYLMVHFIGKNESSADYEQIYFTVSADGTNWTTLNNNAPVLKNTTVGGTGGVRDPYVIRGRNGKFYIIATDLSIHNKSDWTAAQRSGSRNIVIWESTDLANWGEPRLVEVMPEGTGCVWAPEAIYDVEKGKYMVFWASKTSDDSDYGRQRIFRSYTDDFVNFDDAEPYITEDHSVIDTTIVEDKGVFYRFNKWEGQNFIYMEKSLGIDGDWEEVTAYNHRETGFEGPTIFKKNGTNTWCLMLDNYNAKGYQPFVTNDLSSGVFNEESATFESGIVYRHGTVLPITQAEYNAITAKYGTN